MTDYKTEAKDLHCCEAPGCDGHERIAAALEAAEKRGRAAGLREAADIADAFGDQRWSRVDAGMPEMHGKVGTGSYMAASKIRNRAEEVERA